MSEMIFCYGCGKPIHRAAAACPHCGAPAQQQQMPPASPAAPTIAVNNTVVWILAFAPLIGWFLEGVLAYAIHGGNEYAAQDAWNGGNYWFLNLILNIGLSFRDQRMLEKAGVDTKAFKGMVWLVPVYLFQRAKALGHSLAYFVTWLVCVALWNWSLVA